MRKKHQQFPRPPSSAHRAPSCQRQHALHLAPRFRPLQVYPPNRIHRREGLGRGGGACSLPKGERGLRDLPVPSYGTSGVRSFPLPVFLPTAVGVLALKKHPLAATGLPAETRNSDCDARPHRPPLLVSVYRTRKGGERERESERGREGERTEKPVVRLYFFSACPRPARCLLTSSSPPPPRSPRLARGRPSRRWSRRWGSPRRRGSWSSRAPRRPRPPRGGAWPARRRPRGRS